MNNTQEQVVKEFKQWWVAAKNTLKCDEYDAIEIWLAPKSISQTDVLKALTKEYHELSESYVRQGINLYKCQSLITEALEFASEAHSDLNIGMLKMVQILKDE